MLAYRVVSDVVFPASIRKEIPYIVSRLSIRGLANQAL